MKFRLGILCVGTVVAFAHLLTACSDSREPAIESVDGFPLVILPDLSFASAEDVSLLGSEGDGGSPSDFDAWEPLIQGNPPQLIPTVEISDVSPIDGTNGSVVGWAYDPRGTQVPIIDQSRGADDGEWALRGSVPVQSVDGAPAVAYRCEAVDGRDVWDTYLIATARGVAGLRLFLTSALDSRLAGPEAWSELIVGLDVVPPSAEGDDWLFVPDVDDREIVDGSEGAVCRSIDIDKVIAGEPQD